MNDLLIFLFDLYYPPYYLLSSNKCDVDITLTILDEHTMVDMFYW